MSNDPATMNPYDLVPYISVPIPPSHPDRISVVARLFGMTPPNPQEARVLELGCASGGNLLPMAETLPGSTFVGIDLSQRQILAGQEMLRAAGLKNVTLEQKSVLDFMRTRDPSTTSSPTVCTPGSQTMCSKKSWSYAAACCRPTASPTLATTPFPVGTCKACCAIC